MKNSKTYIDTLNSAAKLLGPLQKKFKKNEDFVSTLIDFFKKVPDFRDPSRIVYELSDILCMCLLIAMQGKFSSFFGASRIIKSRSEYFKGYGLIKGDNFPSHDTLQRIFTKIKANELHKSIMNRLQEFMAKVLNADPSTKGKYTLLSGDGKTFNGSGRWYGKRNVNVFNVYDVSTGLMRTSVPLDDKDSEIPTFQKLLRRYNLTGTMVTADALHAQVKTCEAVHSKGGLYTFTVKDNQPSRLQHMKDVMAKNKRKCKYYVHNNCEYLIYFIDYELTEDDFPHAKAFVRMISHKRKAQRDYNPTPQYFVTSADNSQLIIEAIDNRWAIEDEPHFFKDLFLKEDSCTFTEKNAIKTMATLNNIVYALYRIAAAIFHGGDMAYTRNRYECCPEQMLEVLVPLLEKQNLTTLIKQSRAAQKGRSANNIDKPKMSMFSDPYA